MILYIACSLDGYIAESDGGIGFLLESGVSPDDLGYEAFYSSIDAIVMGGKTYRQIATEIYTDQWPYGDKPCYVYSRSDDERDGPAVTFTSLPPAELLGKLRKEGRRNIWLMGGGEIVRLFLEENRIDEYRVYVMPVLLGDGFPLFPKEFPKTYLSLESTKNLLGIAELVYHRR